MNDELNDKNYAMTLITYLRGRDYGGKISFDVIFDENHRKNIEVEFTGNELADILQAIYIEKVLE